MFCQVVPKTQLQKDEHIPFNLGLFWGLPLVAMDTTIFQISKPFYDIANLSLSSIE